MNATDACIRCDALVVGAGPAGASAALHLARRGLRVTLVDRAAFPRAKPCGDALMPGAVEWLQRSRIGIGIDDIRPIDGVRLTVAGKGAREYTFGPKVARALTIPRSAFDHLLVQAAVAAGVRLLERMSAEHALLSRGRVVGARLRDSLGRTHEVFAPWTIGADGGRSRLARSAGLAAPTRAVQGVAVRAYFAGVREPGDLLEILLPLQASPCAMPSAGYGWVFPLARGRVNVGVGVMPGSTAEMATGPRRLLEALVVRLRAADGRFTHIQQLGPLQGATLNCAFDARWTGVEGLLLAGDAAGLVDPFTGEGIQWALESGEAAAQVVADAADRSEATVRRYRDVLADRSRERMHFGRRMVEIRRFAWHLLEQTFESRAPLAGQFRRAMLDLGLEAEARAVEDAHSVFRDRAFARPREFMARVDREIERTVGRDHPLLMRMAREWLAEPDRLVRMTTYWQAAQLGNADDAVQLRGATSVELAALGYRAFAEVSCSPSSRDEASHTDAVPSGGVGQSRRWTDTFAVLAGDFLLARSYRVAAELGAEVCGLLARAGREICRDEANVRSGVRAPLPPAPAARSACARALPVLAAQVACRLGHVAGEQAAQVAAHAGLVAEALVQGETAGLRERLQQLRRTTAVVPAGLVRTQMELVADGLLFRLDPGAGAC